MRSRALLYNPTTSQDAFCLSSISDKIVAQALHECLPRKESTDLSTQFKQNLPPLQFKEYSVWNWDVWFGLLGIIPDNFYIYPLVFQTLGLGSLQREVTCLQNLMSQSHRPKPQPCMRSKTTSCYSPKDQSLQNRGKNFKNVCLLADGRYCNHEGTSVGPRGVALGSPRHLFRTTMLIYNKSDFWHLKD